MKGKYVLIGFVVFVASVIITINAMASSPQPAEAWVDDDWAGSSYGDTVNGHTFGYDAFATIQEGVDAVAEGGIVHVWNGSYYESVWINKTVTIIGNGSINAKEEEGVTPTNLNYTGSFGFFVNNANYTNISGFDIMPFFDFSIGIYINNSNHCNISGNIFAENDDTGIYLKNSSYNTIYNNWIGFSEYGIYLINSSWNVIEKNYIKENMFGILYEPLGGACYNTITHNNISENEYGLTMWNTDNETIMDNEFWGNGFFGIYLEMVNDSIIAYNNFSWNGWDPYRGPPAPPSDVILLGCRNVTVSYNQMLYNQVCGVYMAPSDGVACENVTVEYNNIMGSGYGGIGESYDIYVKTMDGWKLQKELHFPLHYRSLSVDLSSVLPDADGEYKVRIVQHGGSAAHIDYVALIDNEIASPVSATCVDDGDDVLNKLLYEDNDVADAWGKTIEVKWEGNFASPVLVITANEELPANVSPIFTPTFMHPHNMMDYTIQNNGFIAVDGIPDELGEPDFSSFWMPTTGHPAGYTYVWLRSDGEYLYAAMEVTSDNTYDETGWGSIFIYANEMLREFKIDSSNHEYGVDGFVYSSAVPWQHMLYEFKIPLAEIGVSTGDEIKIGYGSYGTLGEQGGIYLTGMIGRACNNTLQYNNISWYSVGIFLSNTDNETIIGNNISYNFIYGMWLEDTEDIIIEENNINNNSEGIFLDGAIYTSIENNLIEENIGDTGIYIGLYSNHTSIEGNTIRNNDIGIYVAGGFSGDYRNADTEIHWNKIYGNSDYGLIYDIFSGTAAPYINATYNFWGNGNGPSNQSMIDPLTGEWANGTGDAIGGGIANDNIHFDPWIGKLILYEGWNTITIPVWNESITTAEDLGEYINSIAGSNVCVIISKWNAKEQRYVSHVVGYGGEGFTLMPGEGYFIYMEQDLNISINGAIVEPAVDIILSSGYNFIGWTKVIPTTAEDLGSNISYCTKIARWNASSQQWMAEYSVAFNLPENFYIIAGDGIFVYRTEGTEHWQG